MLNRFIALALVVTSLGASSPLLAEEAANPSQSSAPTTEATDAGSGSESVCKNGAMVRRVKVEVDGSQRGCKVSYLKETEEPSAGGKVLWNAQQEASYCQDKANGFLEKLKGMGWTCG